MPSLTVAQIAELCGGQIEGDESRVISGADTIENANSDQLSFAENRKAFEQARKSKAGCLIVPTAFDDAGAWTLIRVDRPRLAFARAVCALYPPRVPTPGIHASAIIASSAQVADGCSIGAYAVIGEDSDIGPGSSIAHGCSIGDRVAIGSTCTIHPNVTIYDDVRIGTRVTVHAGSVIGADGFGFTLLEDHYEKFPQIGSVEIGDDVEIGANCCIDRAALGVTQIGAGTKLDNLVHVAHNCVIGRHVLVAAQTGFSGSVVVGDYAAIGGQAGIGEKARIDSKAIVGGKSGILTGQHISAGEPVWGIPARPLRQHLRGLAHVGKLDDAHAELKTLKHRVAALEAASGKNS
jgi:UDP-3-O-[3-hydroxymyristoyl] glucosamine N-acyltransferase